jgi:acetoin utilization protein AcuC
MPTPESWRGWVTERLGVRGPSRMTDGRSAAFRDWSEGYDPDTWLDRAVRATQEAVFPANGLVL